MHRLFRYSIISVLGILGALACTEHMYAADLSLSTTTSSVITDPSYVIAPYDIVEIVVTSAPYCSDVVLIGKTGDISIASLGTIPLRGRTIEECTVDIADHLNIYLSSPIVHCVVHKIRNQVIVTGAIPKNRAVDFRQGMTIRDALIQVGGIVTERYAGTIILTRNGEVFPVTKENTLDATLMPRDIIDVAEQPCPVVYLVGEVAHPGRYVLSSDVSDVFGLVAKAGGFTDFADAAHVKILRVDETGNRRTITVNAKRNIERTRTNDPDRTLCTSDIVYVPTYLPFRVSTTAVIALCSTALIILVIVL